MRYAQQDGSGLSSRNVDWKDRQPVIEGARGERQGGANLGKPGDCPSPERMNTRTGSRKAGPTLSSQSVEADGSEAMSSFTQIARGAPPPNRGTLTCVTRCIAPASASAATCSALKVPEGSMKSPAGVVSSTSCDSPEIR